MENLSNLFISPRISEYKLDKKTGLIKFKPRRLRMITFFVISLILGLISCIITTIMFCSNGYDVSMAISGSVIVGIEIACITLFIALAVDVIMYFSQRAKFKKQYGIKKIKK